MKRVTLWAVSGLLLLLCAIPAWSQTTSDRPVAFDHGIPVFQLPTMTVTGDSGPARVAERNSTPYTAVPVARTVAPGEEPADTQMADGGQTRYVRMHVIER